MSRANVVIISGAPATMKTSIGLEISGRLGYAFISKDALKEKLYDQKRRTLWNYGWFKRRANSQFLVEFQRAQQDSQNVVLDSNFTSVQAKRMQRLFVDANLVELHCYCRGLSGFKRFVRRNKSGKRHKSHYDWRWYPDIFVFACLRMLKVYDAFPPTGLTQNVLQIDTTKPDTVDYAAIQQFIQKTLRP